MRKGLPGLDSGCMKTVRLLPVVAAFAASLLVAAPGWAVAGEQEAATPPVAVAGARAEDGPATAGFVRDDHSPMLLAAQAKPQAQAAQASPAAQATPAPPASQAAQGQGDVEALAAQRAAAQDAQASAAQDAQAPGPKKTSIRLFDTVEFRGVLKNMPKWQRVVAAEQRSRTFDGDLSTVMRPASVYKQWQELVERVKNASDMEKAKAVTAFFNRWPYKTDQAVYKVSDYWATPKEFLLNSGDCEDYAITKFYALMKLGVDPENMRVVALMDTIRNLAHAVLVIYIDDDAYVLDNLTTLVLSHARYQHYAPQYSINEVYRWAHVRPKKK
ncbi:Transglutaminase family protein cysteine peptidase BTLCP (fragment) [uncultured delta proteobacterium]|uniref:Transglutaminase family protein cysteine peptidase BTLCP n=1 Tax=uncultured delta proteobacterium TaxID=34034 RepID=A0A212KBW9_9DELT